jgi:hypothetical protein
MPEDLLRTSEYDLLLLLVGIWYGYTERGLFVQPKLPKPITPIMDNFQAFFQTNTLETLKILIPPPDLPGESREEDPDYAMGEATETELTPQVRSAQKPKGSARKRARAAVITANVAKKPARAAVVRISKLLPGITLLWFAVSVV